MTARSSLTTALGVALVITGASVARAQPEATPRDVLAELPVEEGGLSADAVAARAARVSPQVRAAVVARAEAERTSRRSRAGFAPRLDLEASYLRDSRVDQPPLIFDGTELDNPFPQILDRYSFVAAVTVPVTDYFFTIAPRYRAGKHSADVARYQAEAEKQAAALVARQAFYSLARAEMRVVIAEDAVRMLRAQVEDLEAFVAAGESTRADLMQARAQLADAEVEAAAAGADVAASQERLRQLLDLEDGAGVAIGENVFADVDLEVPDRDALVREALRARAEVKALRAVAAAQGELVNVARGGGWPRVSIVGGLTYANPNPRVIPQEQEFDVSWSVGVTLSWSPNDFVAKRVETDRAEVDVRRTLADLEALEQRLEVEGTRLVAELRLAIDAASATLRGVEAAREAWRVRRDLFSAGEATANDVLVAQSALRRAQLSQVDALLRARIAEARLDHFVGRAL